MNISGVVVRTVQEKIEIVSKNLREGGLCEIHAIDEETGKIIITIEGESVEEEVKKLEQIQKLEGVFTADLAYTYSDQDYTREKIESHKNTYKQC